MINTPVVIAGGGPVGMTLALELARHNVESILLERKDSTTRHPKMDLTNGRSMELYRKLGISDRLRSVGVSSDNPFDVMWATSPSGFLLHRFEYPSPNEWLDQARKTNDGTQTAEPPLRVSQILIEPELKKCAEASPLIDVRFGWVFEEYSELSDKVVVSCIDPNGEKHSLEAEYLAGCDGAASSVRRQAGIGLEGDRDVARILMIHFRSPDSSVLNPWGIAWHFQTPTGTIVAQDDVDTWTLHTVLDPEVDESSLDMEQILRDYVGQDFEFEILVANPYSPSLVVADRYRNGRILLAGDSAHQIIPTGGYGMNSGVADAAGLGWKLAAIIKGWGGTGLLDGYESERRQIAFQNREASRSHFAVRMELAEIFEQAISEGSLEESGTKGEERRKSVSAQILELGNAENESWGIQHGYRYEGSPIILSETSPPPAFDPLHCIPTCYAGARLPHVWLDDGGSLFDLLGPEFSLISIGDHDTDAFVDVANRYKMPLTVVRLPDQRPLDVLDRKLIIVRPDQHIAWSGNQPPSDPGAIVSCAIGRL